MVALFVLDNVDEVADKPAAQRELCAAIDALVASGGRAIITARKNPIREARLSAPLVSRLASGLTIPLAKPGKHGRAAVLAALALARGLALSAAAIARIADRGPASVPELAGMIVQLDMAARAEGRDVDDALVCEYFGTEDHTGITLRKITQQVAEHFEIKASKLRSPMRRKEVVAARCVAIYLARQLTDESLEAIGRHFAGRDHATVGYNVRKVESLIAAGDVETTQAVMRIKERLLDER
jgi:chromosomal replication initiator protein